MPNMTVPNMCVEVAISVLSYDHSYVLPELGRAWNETNVNLVSINIMSQHWLFS